jgi:hypothetical protein
MSATTDVTKDGDDDICFLEPDIGVVEFIEFIEFKLERKYPQYSLRPPHFSFAALKEAHETSPTLLELLALPLEAKMQNYFYKLSLIEYTKNAFITQKFNDRVFWDAFFARILEMFRLLNCHEFNLTKISFVVPKRHAYLKAWRPRLETHEESKFEPECKYFPVCVRSRDHDSKREQKDSKTGVRTLMRPPPLQLRSLSSSSLSSLDSLCVSDSTPEMPLSPLSPPFAFYMASASTTSTDASTASTASDTNSRFIILDDSPNLSDLDDEPS